MKNTNGLSKAQVERLAILIEEAGEVIQAASKILRHGYESTNPNNKKSNGEALTEECGDFLYALSLLKHFGDLDESKITNRINKKIKSFINNGNYTHHQGHIEGEVHPIVSYWVVRDVYLDWVRVLLRNKIGEK